MTTILYIHGTGVRGDGISAYVEQLSRGLQRIRPTSQVTAVPWGDLVGAELLADGISIPSGLPQQHLEPLSANALISDDTEDTQVRLWEILDTAPLVELDALLAQHGSTGLSPDERHARTLADRLGQGLEPGTALHQELVAAGLSGTAMAAATQLVASDQFTELAAMPQLPLENKSACFARAFIALSLGLRDAELGCFTPLDGGHRERLEALTAQGLVWPDAPPDTIQTQFSGFLLEGVLALVTLWAARNRVKLTHQTAAGIGDVLKYLSRGESLRELISTQLQQIDDEQIIIVAHSLGAMAALDLLIASPHPKVKSLVCVATQSGLLFELDALPSTPFQQDYRLPQHCPATHFIFDPKDLLAHKSGGLFGPRLSDHSINNRAPFPRNHGAYFNNEAFYELLDRILPNEEDPASQGLT